MNKIMREQTKVRNIEGANILFYNYRRKEWTKEERKRKRRNKEIFFLLSRQRNPQQKKLRIIFPQEKRNQIDSYLLSNVEK